MKILLVDDDKEIVKLVSRRLKQDNYVVEVATDGEFAIDLLQASPYNLILLDVMLPNLSGVEVCQTLRNQGNKTPILMLTGRDHITDKVTGLDAGADDYLVKPFLLDELTARVRALLRRNSEVSSAVINYGPLRFDPRTQRLTYLENPIELRPKELAILELMLRYPTQIFETDGLLNRLWDLADCPGKATVKVHIGSLRKQLAKVGAKDVVETVYGQGYRLNPALLEEMSSVSEACLSHRHSTHHQPAQPKTTTDVQAKATQKFLDETWEEVQTTSWHRVCRLDALVRSLSPSTVMVNGAAQEVQATSDQAPASQRCFTAAIAIAHQLKGVLGSFGFKSASLQAKHIEALLSARASDSVEIALLQAQVGTLKQLLKQHMTDDPESHQSHRLHQVEGDLSSVDSPSLETAHILVAARDAHWAKTLLHHQQDSPFQIEVCSPLSIEEFLLEHTPSAIVLELSNVERDLDLSVLDILVSNYEGQVPILAVLEESRPDEQLVAIYHGANAILLKTWSPEALLTMIAEYI